MKTKLNLILTLMLAFVVQISFAQEKMVTGVVTDAENIPLPGVSVTVKGKSVGTQTDFDGVFQLSVTPADVLTFEYVGFKKAVVTVGSKSQINVKLETDDALDEVIVTAYGGILKASEVVSSVSTVKASDIEQIPIASVDQILQGQVAGLNIRTNSGQPGQAATTILRGRTSISGNTQPLYIVDGMPVNEDNFRSINPNDIASIDVQKDAAGTAIYGNRGAAGVIIITTKNAKRNSGLSIQYRNLVGFRENPESNVDMMNTSQLLTWRRDVLGSGTGVGMTDERIAAIAASNNTNWADVLFRTGRTDSHQLTFTQGGENMSSFTSIQYFEQEGTSLRSKLRRFSVRNNMEGGDDKFKYGTTVSLNYSENDFVVDATRGGNTGGQLDNPFIVPFLGLPNLNPRNPDGSLNIIGTVESGALNPDGSFNVSGANGFQNTPFLALNTQALNTDRENEFRMLVGGNLSYKISDKISVGGSANLDYFNQQTLSIDAPGSIRGALTPNQQAATEFFGGTQFENFFRDLSINTNANVTYKDRFGADDKHSIGAAVYTEYFYRNVQNAGFQAFGLNPAFPGSGSGFVDPRTIVLDGEDETYPFVPNVFSSEAETAILSYFGRVTYDYDGRFGGELTIRRDGTSRFAQDYRWGTFFSVGGRWNIDEEAFMKDVDWISALKMRASYGEIGNQDVGGFFPGFQTYVGGTGYQNNVQLSPGGLADTQIQWETTAQTNIGFDYGLWNNRLTGAVDIYRKETRDLFFRNNLSQAGTGFSNVETNVGDMRNQGIELEFSYDILRKSATNDWALSVFLNGAYNKNEILDLKNETGFVEAGSQQRLQEGLPIFSYFMQEWAGVNPADGRALYYTSDGQLTTDYDRDLHGVYNGKQFDPFWTGGFGINASWKQFTLTSLFTFQYDAWRANGTVAITEDPGLAGFANMNQSMLSAWQQPGDVTGIPATAFGSLRGQAGDRYLEDASFLRLRNVNLAYNFSAEQLESLGFINGLRIFVQGTNLFVLSEWRGFDPETADPNEFFNFPLAREITAGVDITF